MTIVTWIIDETSCDVISANQISRDNDNMSYQDDKLLRICISLCQASDEYLCVIREERTDA